MSKNFKTLSFLLLLATTVMAQDSILKPVYVQNEMDSITKEKFNSSLESLFASISLGNINENFLTADRLELTKSQLQEFVTYESRKDSVSAKVQDKQLINIYPISADEYFFSIVYINGEIADYHPVLFYSINLIATKTEDKFTFSVPLDHLTRYWKTETVGHITYHFRGELNKARAEIFDQKNTLIAQKLGVEPEQLDFYLCDDFQELSELLGFDYSLSSNGKYRDGYGVDAKTIFSVMNNEDFSHDIFHYYSAQINDRMNRNWITEEGIAYAWGNAYYTDREGEMITHERLIDELKKYLAENPKTDLFELFMVNPKIFNHIAPEISVQSTLSGVLAMEVEKQKGMEGLLALINAGRQDRLESYLKVSNELIGINKDNFNAKVGKLLRKY